MEDTSPNEDTSLDDLRLRLAPLIAEAAVFDGWSNEAVRVAAEQAGVDSDVALYAFRGGAMDMIAAWIGAGTIMPPCLRTASSSDTTSGSPATKPAR